MDEKKLRKELKKIFKHIFKAIDVTAEKDAKEWEKYKSLPDNFRLVQEKSVNQLCDKFHDCFFKDIAKEKHKDKTITRELLHQIIDARYNTSYLSVHVKRVKDKKKATLLTEHKKYAGVYSELTKKILENIILAEKTGYDPEKKEFGELTAALENVRKKMDGARKNLQAHESGFLFSPKTKWDELDWRCA